MVKTPKFDNFVCITVGFFLLGCGHGMSTHSRFMSDAEYRSREALSTSLFSNDQKSLSNEDVEKVLSSRVQLRSGGRLAVVRLSEAGDWATTVNSWSLNWSHRNAMNAKDGLGASVIRFVDRLRHSNLYKDVSVLPNMVIPERPSISAIREMGARFQADSVLVFRPYTTTHERIRFWTADEAKANVAIEAILLDTRTGAIPFTAIAGDDFFVKKTDKDLDLFAAAIRAKAGATEVALVRIADRLISFIQATKGSKSK